jgi:Predicted transcriptional regulator containing CBS domains
MNILFLLLPKNQVDYLFEDFTVRQALEKLEGKRYSMIPVINRKSGKYERALMEGDFLYYLTRNHLSFGELEKMNLQDVPASRDIQAVGVNCQIKELYDKIIDQNFVPVVDDNGVFIGIVTRRSVMRTLLPDSGTAEK